jgi:hypothetical protein
MSDFVRASGYDVKFDFSNRQNKKYKVYIKQLNKTVHFGDDRYQHYKTNPKIYQKNRELYVPEWEHNDKERRGNYQNRAEGITDKNGDSTYNDVESPNFWSYHYLW